MSKKQPGKRVKHVPQRTCVGCREVLPKRTMIRIVRTADGVQIDLTGKLAGRGAYLHDKQKCWEQGLKGALSNALKTTLKREEREKLEEYMSALPQEAEGTGTAGKHVTV